MKGCVAEQKVSDWQMNAWTLRACDTVRVLSFMDVCLSQEVYSQNRLTHSFHKHV